jgi:hypothetical protein
MKSNGLALVLFSCASLLTAALAQAGEPLVIKAAEGKYIPAAASEWAAAGDGAFRFLLKTGVKAATVAAELEGKIAPIKVEAKDELTLLFSGPGLTEQALLEKLASVELGGDKAMGDAIAALTDLGAGAPSMGDMSSAGSIRASKAIELPDDDTRKKDPSNLIGEVIGYEPCKPVPVLHIKVLRAPIDGEHKAAFKVGDKIPVRGYYKIKDGSKALDQEDPRTKINVQSSRIKLGAKIFGKPFVKDGDEWVLETVEAL